MDILVAKLEEVDTSWQPLWSEDRPKSADSMSYSPYGKSHKVSDQVSTTLKLSEANEKLESHSNDGTSDAHLLGYCEEPRPDNWEAIRSCLPESWMWDVEYSDSCWTYVSTEPDEPIQLPLTIAGQPLVLPVEYRWPPMAGVVPPPDPRPSMPIDCKTELSLEIIRDILITFKGSIGFYMLINGLLQIIIPIDFDTVWASSHLPHKYGGLKICYIPQDREPTMFTNRTKASSSTAQDITQSSPPSERLKLTKEGNKPIAKPLRLNDFIEARPKSSFMKERFSGRIGLRVVKNSESYLLMSTHVITEAILSKSLVSSVLRRGHRFEKLDEDWNKHVAIWAGNEKIGDIAKTFDQKAGYYPDGFYHDVTLVKPADEASTSSILSPIPNLGWINKSVHGTFRHRSQHIRFLGDVSGLHSDRRAKTLKTNTYSEALIVGQGVLRNQANFDESSIETEFGYSKWSELISTSILYRVAPDFDPPNGYSGIALCADGERQDGTEGPGVLGFQSFVQRSGAVQNFNMEGDALAARLKHGRVAFYGAYPVPEELKEYAIA
ncbi:hypothetical protein BS50DRAFT_635541 [Corynespora cassiicola Philippines]|uniref:Uncharacterized protein n=1 Tax=Corynespora cassiicola Philippines TaxID=1448308 RepID=A0A2T2NLW6_CORCC|nr:hypothetical protein BS50DRAFT_635541 [Corynespora cassiicola Philippines]